MKEMENQVIMCKSLLIREINKSLKYVIYGDSKYENDIDFKVTPS